MLLLFVTYQLWGTGQYTEDQQKRLSQELFKTWSASAPTGKGVTTERVKIGSGLALLRIPRLGKSFRYVVIEGVERSDLRKGPGHYPGTALPGQLGNFVVSGHRTTYSAPFNRLDRLRDGDEIWVDTQTTQYVYRVTGQEIVKPKQVEVAAPVPYHPGRRPVERVITLTTCHPKYSAAQRLVVFGELVRTLPRAVKPTSDAAPGAQPGTAPPGTARPGTGSADVGVATGTARPGAGSTDGFGKEGA